MKTGSGVPLPSRDECIAGALAHVGALISAIGRLIPNLIWITQKDRSHFYDFQALQAAAYQLILTLASFLGWVWCVGSLLLAFVFLALTKYRPGWSANVPLLIPFPILLVMVVGWLVFSLYTLPAADLTFPGRDFHDLIIGPLVDGFLQKRGGRMPHVVEVHRQGLTISTDPHRLDLEAIRDFLAQSYWAQTRSRRTIQRSLRHSLVFGVYDQDRQVAMARLVTDYATFGWVCDVFVQPDYRGRGISKWLMETIMAHPDLQGLKRWVLISRDAQGLYSRYGFTSVQTPERWMEKFNPDAT